MSTRRFPLLRFSLLSLCILCVGRLSADANMADPSRPGDPVGEPSPLLDSIHVLSEQLTIDMRPAAERNPAVVQARYRLRNNGAAKTLDLMFVAGGLSGGSVDSADDFAVRLNDMPITGRFSDSLPLPLSWGLPSYTPGLGEADSLPYDVSLRASRVISSTGDMSRDSIVFSAATPVILFSISLPPGEHTVTVTYRADPAGYPYGAPVYTWQLGYVLSPARRWGSFGRLDAQILLPEGWEAATWPETKRSGDTLYGSWNGLPADAIALSTHLPVSSTVYAIAQLLPVLLFFILAMLLTFRMGWKKGRKLAAEGKSLVGAVPVAILSTILTFLMLGGSLVAIDVWTQSLVDGQGVPGYPVYFVFAPVFIFPPLLLVLLIPSPVTMVAAAMGRRRALRDDPSLQIGSPEPKEGI